MKKGFTLTELLVVIVLLSVLAMLVYPKVVNQIEKKTTTLEEKKMMLIYSASDEYLKKHSNIYSKEIGNKYFLKVDDLVKENLIAIDIEGFDDKCVIVTVGRPNGHEIGDCGEDIRLYDNFKRASSNDTYLGIVYMDPTDLRKVCTKKEAEENVNASGLPTGITSGCMKWYAYSETEDKSGYNLILDHNTTLNVHFNSSGSSSTMKEAATALATDTTGWDPDLDVRLISAPELATIVNCDTFNVATTPYGSGFYFDTTTTTPPTGMTTGSSKYAWLFDYIASCTSNGCNIEDSTTTGYWTSSPGYGRSDVTWCVNSAGKIGGYYSYLYQGDSNRGALMGLRPVVTISKSILK